MDTVVNGGKGPQPNLERNEGLKRDYLAGLRVEELEAKYDLTKRRIYIILKNMGVKPSRYAPDGSKKKKAKK